MLPHIEPDMSQHTPQMDHEEIVQALHDLRTQVDGITAVINSKDWQELPRRMQTAEESLGRLHRFVFGDQDFAGLRETVKDMTAAITLMKADRTRVDDIVAKQAKQEVSVDTLVEDRKRIRNIVYGVGIGLGVGGAAGFGALYSKLAAVLALLPVVP